VTTPFAPTSHQLYPELLAYLHHRASALDEIPAERRADLARLVDYIRQRIAASQPVRLTFICTHNSRRSQLSQVWAHVAAVCYGVKHIETFSGGTEVTAFNHRAVAALRRCGLQVQADEPNASNPRYSVSLSDSLPPLVCFSKRYDQAPNPTAAYAGVMTCSHADEACPVVMGCDLRIPIRYEDPKIGDDTDQEAQLYSARSNQIATEMLYLMSLI